MSEVSPGVAYAQAVYAETVAAISEAVDAVRPGEPHANPLDVFDPPYPVRADAPNPGYDERTEARVRVASAKLGSGRPDDLLPSALNLPGEEGEHHIVASTGLLDTKGKSVMRTVRKALAEYPR